jgi:hypothetical protein
MLLIIKRRVVGRVILSFGSWIDRKRENIKMENMIANAVEAKIYDLITDSAKKRFDYEGFENEFSNNDLGFTMGDNALWLILMNLAMGESPIMIAGKLNCELLMTGLYLDYGSIDETIMHLEAIISDNLKNWQKEIGILKMVTDMFNSNSVSVEHIYEMTARLLDQ